MRIRAAGVRAERSGDDQEGPERVAVVPGWVILAVPGATRVVVLVRVGASGPSVVRPFGDDGCAICLQGGDLLLAIATPEVVVQVLCFRTVALCLGTLTRGFDSFVSFPLSPLATDDEHDDENDDEGRHDAQDRITPGRQCVHGFLSGVGGALNGVLSYTYIITFL